MTALEPDSLNIRLRFMYRGCKVEIDHRSYNNRTFYVAWVHYPKGCAIATSNAPTKILAIRRAKSWVNQKLLESS